MFTEQTALTSLRQWDARILRIWEQAMTLSSVNLRVEGVNQPTPANILLDYKTSQVRWISWSSPSRFVTIRITLMTEQ